MSEFEKYRDEYRKQYKKSIKPLPDIDDPEILELYYEEMGRGPIDEICRSGDWFYRGNGNYKRVKQSGAE